MRKIVFVLILFLFPAAGWAGEYAPVKGDESEGAYNRRQYRSQLYGQAEYVLKKGQGVEVCEAHFKNLETLTLNEMVCQRDESYPEANGITMPKWEELDLKENKELVKRIGKFFTFGDQFIKDEMLDSEGYFNSQTLKYNSLKKTTADIDNDGKPEIVMLYREPRCDVERNIAYNIPYSRSLFVLDEAKNQIDVKKTEPLLQNISKSGYDIKTKAIESIYRLYDVFFYKKDTYFDKWFIRDWTLTVYKLSNDRGSEVCRYKYEQKLKKQGGLKP
ncbi:MAG: hypothetical protein HY026_11160 [Deltaproteobacteria bacterium]|nr:hypothetical protein [Deltaproteobacteria bacterium]